MCVRKCDTWTFCELKLPAEEKSLYIFECPVKLSADLQTKPHVGQVCFFRKCRQSLFINRFVVLLPMRFEVIYHTCLWQEKTSAHATRRLQHYHLEFGRACFNAACSIHFCSKLLYLSLVSFPAGRTIFGQCFSVIHINFRFLKIVFKTSLKPFSLVSIKEQSPILTKWPAQRIWLRISLF